MWIYDLSIDRLAGPVSRAGPPQLVSCGPIYLSMNLSCSDRNVSMFNDGIHMDVDNDVLMESLYENSSHQSDKSSLENLLQVLGDSNATK